MRDGPDLRLGIDVGGTNTDAAVLDRQGALVAKAKRPTSPDVTGGITAALDAVLAESAVDPVRIRHVMLGTTHATNAVLESAGSWASSHRRTRSVTCLAADSSAPGSNRSGISEFFSASINNSGKRMHYRYKIAG